MPQKKKAEPVEKVIDLQPRVNELESAIEHAVGLMDPKGTGAPEPGTPGYMIGVMTTLKSVLDKG